MRTSAPSRRATAVHCDPAESVVSSSALMSTTIFRPHDVELHQIDERRAAGEVTEPGLRGG